MGSAWKIDGVVDVITQCGDAAPLLSARMMKNAQGSSNVSLVSGNKIPLFRGLQRHWIRFGKRSAHLQLAYRSLRLETDQTRCGACDRTSGGATVRRHCRLQAGFVLRPDYRGPGEITDFHACATSALCQRQASE
jgi:hypothetical protein